MTGAQVLSEMLHILVKFNTITTTVSLSTLLFCVWLAPTRWELTEKAHSAQFLLGLAFIMRMLVSRTNRYLVFSRVGTASAAAQIANRLWGAPCKATRHPI